MTGFFGFIRQFDTPDMASKYAAEGRSMVLDNQLN